VAEGLFMVLKKFSKFLRYFRTYFRTASMQMLTSVIQIGTLPKDATVTGTGFLKASSWHMNKNWKAA
jgi:uncharacterized membrane protein